MMAETPLGNELIEQLAAQEHERWSSWMRYMFDHWTVENVARWKQQMITPYAELPEHSKESDRKEARKTMEIVGPLIAQLEADLSGMKLMEAEAEQFAEGMELVPEGTLAENKWLREAVIYAKALCYKHGTGDDACHCEIYNTALRGES